MEIHVLYKLDDDEEIPKALSLKPNDIERLKKLHPSLRALSICTVKEVMDNDIPKNIKNRLTK